MRVRDGSPQARKKPCMWPGHPDPRLGRPRLVFHHTKPPPNDTRTNSLTHPIISKTGIILKVLKKGRLAYLYICSTKERKNMKFPYRISSPPPPQQPTSVNFNNLPQMLQTCLQYIFLVLHQKASNCNRKVYIMYNINISKLERIK